MALQGKSVLTPSTKVQGCGAGLLQQQHSSVEEPNLASGFLPASPLETAVALGFVSEGQLLLWTSCDLSQVAKWGCTSSTALLGRCWAQWQFFETVPPIAALGGGGWLW